jgi:hypothetical protein
MENRQKQKCLVCDRQTERLVCLVCAERLRREALRNEIEDEREGKKPKHLSAFVNVRCSPKYGGEVWLRLEQRFREGIRHKSRNYFSRLACQDQCAAIGSTCQRTFLYQFKPTRRDIA